MIIGYKTIKTRDFIESGKEDTLLLSIFDCFLEGTDGRDHLAAHVGSRHGLAKDGRAGRSRKPCEGWNVHPHPPCCQRDYEQNRAKVNFASYCSHRYFINILIQAQF